MLIQQLSPHVADLIAAGEVVERPASVVKELIENAIDAGANAVTIEISGGGMSSIRVTDNGCGIAPEELSTAFLRHATSKLRTVEDLGAIATLGFRGEALAAIAAVSRIDIFSRQAGALSGASLSLEGGIPGTVEEAGCPEGTTIVVRELFYNTPARLKFMKSDTAEASAVAALLQQIALSHPEISIKYLRDGKEELHTPGDSKLLSAIYAARGREFALNLTSVDGGGEEIRVRGFVTNPLAGRGSRTMQTFFCCGRLIKSPLLTAALEEAYLNRQMKGKFPGCVLHIDLPPHMVDVNVHPAKTTVKFANERAVFSAVHHTVQDALDDTPRKTVQKAPAAQNVPRNDFYQTMDAKTFRERQETGKISSTPPRRTAVITSPEMGGHTTFHDSGRAIVSSSKLPKSDMTHTVSVRQEPVSPISPTATPPVRQEVQIPLVQEAVTSAPTNPIGFPVTVESPAEPEQISFVPPQPVSWRFVGEVLHTYIIAEDGEDVWLIDKHAAHERINFDRMKANQEPVMRQQLLAGIAVDLPRDQYAVLLEQLALLEEFGFEAEDFGDGAIMVRAIPSDLPTDRVCETLEMLAQRLLTCAHADSSTARDAVLHTMACKASIKGGWKSDDEELKFLVDKVANGEVAFCPHGRPVKVKLSKYEIEKMFKRA